MKKSKTYTVSYRRKREKKTNYKKRMTLLVSGKARLVVRKSLKNLYAQIIKYNEKGDQVIVAAKSSDLKSMGWNYNPANLSSAYLLGILIGKKAQESGIKGAIMDIGLANSVSGSKVYAVLKGAIDSGLNIPYSEDVLPTEERIAGKHIAEYAGKLNDEENKKRFSGYQKNNVDPEKIQAVFEDIKKKITGA